MKSIISGFFVATLATLATWSPVLANEDCPFNGGGGMWGHGMGGAHGMSGMMHGGMHSPFMMILFFAVLVVIAILLIKWLGCGCRHRHSHGRCTHRRAGYPGKTPEDILRERFARGEIDKAEFEERRSVLGS